MERGMFVHQFDQCAEQSPADYAKTLLFRGITTVYVKAMDGTSWMGDFYADPLAPHNLTEWHDLVAQFRDAGLALIPWVVPRSSASEAQPHIDAGQVAGGLAIDFEYRYAGFWNGPDSEARAYFDAMRAAAGDGLWVAAAPDPRQPGRDYDPSLIAGLTAYLPQVYWTDFQQACTSVLQSAHERLSGLGPVEPILPWNASPEDMTQALQWAHGAGYGALSLWRMGVANADQLDAFAQHVEGEDDQPAPEPEPDPDQDPRDQRITALETALGDVTGADGEIRTALKSLSAQAVNTPLAQALLDIDTRLDSIHQQFLQQLHRLERPAHRPPSNQRARRRVARTP